MSRRTFDIGPGLTCHVDRLVSSRLLIQAMSGAGKSWTLRRVLEQSHGMVQQLVIDPEGEFSSLREHFDYVLAARQGGDTLADPRTAKLLAERLLELGVSAVLDIYELQPHERVRFVRTFLETIVEAPKSLWHPCLIVLDEAHVYAPEKGDAESADAVKGLATRGRKRGFCLVAATQRLSKLHKDVAAECANKLIGRTTLDVDMQRAGDELGFSKADRLKLRDLGDGEFYAFGPALTKTVELYQVGNVRTTHPKAGGRLAAVVPPPTATVKALLPKLSDLPAEAEARVKTEKDLRAEIADLKRRLTLAEKAQKPAERVEVPIIPAEDLQAVVKAGAAIEAVQESLSELSKPLRDGIERVTQALDGIARLRTSTLRVTPPAHRPSAPPSPTPRLTTREVSTRQREKGSGADDAKTLGAGERKVLTAVAQYPDGVTREQLTVLTGYKRSSRDTYLQRLGAAGYVDVNAGKVVATEKGVAELGDFEPLPTGDDLRAHWLERLPEGERRILEALTGKYPDYVQRDWLTEQTGYKRSSRDTYLQRMNAKRLVEHDRGFIRASSELFS